MAARCPICREPVSPASDAVPFCSKRCRLIDLGNWLGDRYRISEEEPTDDRPATEREDRH